MADSVRIPAATQLRKVAVDQREGVLIPINEYKPTSFEYGATNPNALSDGDEKGKGETSTIGNKTDILSRNTLFGVNQYTDGTPYTSPE
jgi:hypothetical protein